MTSQLPHRVILPGRTRVLRLCHLAPAGCADCLARVAAFLAEELDYELEAAIERPTEAYRRDLGDAACTLDQARDLRRRTCMVCYLHRPMRREADGHGYDSLILADLDLPQEFAHA